MPPFTGSDQGEVFLCQAVTGKPGGSLLADNFIDVAYTFKRRGRGKLAAGFRSVLKEVLFPERSTAQDA